MRALNVGERGKRTTRSRVKSLKYIVAGGRVKSGRGERGGREEKRKTSLRSLFGERHQHGESGATKVGRTLNVGRLTPTEERGRKRKGGK